MREGSEDRKRDYIDKRADYAKADIPEYWIGDPFDKAITVLKLEGAEYLLHGRFEKDQTATAATLKGFSVNYGENWAGAAGVSVGRELFPPSASGSDSTGQRSFTAA